MDLSKRALLAKVTVHRHYFEEKDLERKKELAEKYGCDPKLFDINKTTMLKEFTKEIQSVCDLIHPTFNKYTQPWKEGGWRILNVNNYSKLEQDIRALNENLGKALDRFIPLYDHYKEESMLKLGGMSTNIDYPSAEYVRSRFSIEVSYDPITTSGDFRIEIGQDEVEQIKKVCDERNNRSLKVAMEDAWNRVVTAIEKIYNSFSAEEYEWTNKAGEIVMRKPRIFQSNIDNIRELIDLLPSLNITNDPNLNNIKRELEDKFLEINVEDIKDDDVLRKSKAKEAEDLLNNIKTLL
jgi:hypothetical protein